MKKYTIEQMHGAAYIEACLQVQAILEKFFDESLPMPKVEELAKRLKITFDENGNIF